MMSFFIRKPKFNKGGNKRKKEDSKQKGSSLGIPLSKKSKALNEELSSDSEEDEVDIDGDEKADNQKRLLNEEEKGVSSDDEYEHETAQEKKIRVAKKYLEQIETQEKERRDVDMIDKSVISGRLRDDVLEQAGKLQKKVADNYLRIKDEEIRYLKNGHKLSVTCIVVSSDCKFIFSASKDSSIIKWDFKTGKKLSVIAGEIKGKKKKGSKASESETNKLPKVHSSCILALAISSDSKFLASSCHDKLIQIWNPDSMQHIHTFKGHRGPVSGLSFRKNSHQLFSCSHDRSVKLWSLDEMTYVETLFGHQENIMAIDSLVRERAITAGGRDNTSRIWKIIEESQLVFQGNNNASIDCVKFINEQHFVTASDDGSISLWGALKKKPLTTLASAHGKGDSVANWIASIAAFRNTDLLASGSQDGMIRFWKCSHDFKRLEPIFEAHITGFVNSMEFSSDGDYLVAGIGQEHRLGRWWRIKEARNCIAVIPLLKKDE